MGDGSGPVVAMPCTLLLLRQRHSFIDAVLIIIITICYVCMVGLVCSNNA